MSFMRKKLEEQYQSKLDEIESELEETQDESEALRMQLKTLMEHMEQSGGTVPTQLATAGSADAGDKKHVDRLKRELMKQVRRSPRAYRSARKAFQVGTKTALRSRRRARRCAGTRRSWSGCAPPTSLPRAPASTSSSNSSPPPRPRFSSCGRKPRPVGAAGVVVAATRRSCRRRWRS